MAIGEAFVTHATRDDVPEILSMIREHAEYEGHPSSCVTDEESLLRTLSFAPLSKSATPGFARALVVRVPSSSFSPGTHQSEPRQSSSSSSSSAVAGLAVYVYNYSTWRGKPGVFLDDLFVRPQYRKRGFGKLLLQSLAQEVLKVDGCRLEWSCAAANASGLRFYRNLGAKEMREWIPLRLEWDALEDLAAVGGKGRRGSAAAGVGVAQEGPKGFR